MMVEGAQRAMRRNYWRIGGWSLAASLILLPLVAMQFSHEVHWGPEDFVVALVLIGGVGISLELAVRVSGDRAYLAGTGLALAAGFMLIWGNLAVGFVGSEDNPANWMFFGLPALALAGAIIARFRAAGMTLAMIAAAVGQLGIAAVVLVGQMGPESAGWQTDVFGLTGFFTSMCLGSAWCFSRAGRTRA